MTPKTIVPVRLDAALLAEADARAKADDTDRSAVIRRALEIYVGRKDRVRDELAELRAENQQLKRALRTIRDTADGELKK